MSKHWEFDSQCPKCNKLNHVKAPEGEKVVRVKCVHCTHSYSYTHVIREHTEVEDEDE